MEARPFSDFYAVTLYFFPHSVTSLFFTEQKLQMLYFSLFLDAAHSCRLYVLRGMQIIDFRTRVHLLYDC